MREGGWREREISPPFYSGVELTTRTILRRGREEGEAGGEDGGEEGEEGEGEIKVWHSVLLYAFIPHWVTMERTEGER